MSLNKNEARPSSSSTVIKYLTGVMAVLFILGGTAILFKHNAIEARLNNKGALGPYPLALGIVLILYGCFRGYRTYRNFFPTEDDDE